MWPENLRGTFYFVTVWVMCVIEIITLVLLTDPKFFALYMIAWVVLAVSTCCTAGFGVAEWLQARYDERKFRRQVEKELLEANHE